MDGSPALPHTGWITFDTLYATDRKWIMNTYVLSLSADSYMFHRTLLQHPSTQWMFLTICRISERFVTFFFLEYYIYHHRHFFQFTGNLLRSVLSKYFSLFLSFLYIATVPPLQILVYIWATCPVPSAGLMQGTRSDDYGPISQSYLHYRWFFFLSARTKDSGQQIKVIGHYQLILSS